MESKYCTRCGKELTQEMRFCPSCGAPTSHAVEGPEGFSTPSLTPNAIAFFCYFVPVAGPVLFLNLRPYTEDREVRFHAWQSLYFTAAWVLLHIAVGIVSFPFALLHLPFYAILWPLLNLGLGLVWIYLLVQALSAKRVSLPVVGELAASRAYGPG